MSTKAQQIRAEDETPDTELPEGWAAAKLGNCFFDLRNGTTTLQNPEMKGVPVSRIESVQKGRFDLNRLGYIDDPPADLVDRFRYRHGDIALSHINSYEHVGKTAIYDDTPKLLLHGMNLLRLRLGHEHILPDFAYFFMQTPRFREDVRSRVGHAVNQVSINQKNLADVPLMLAPFPEQIRVVERLRTVLPEIDSPRARLQKIQMIMKKLRQAVLAAACSGRLTEDWRRQHPANADSRALMKQLLARRRELLSGTKKKYRDPIEASDELPDLPDGWRWISVDAISTKVVDGVHHTPEYVEYGIPFVTVRNLTAGPGISFESINFISSADHKRFIERANPERGDILVSKDGTLGVIRAIRTDREFSIFVSVAMIKPVLADMTDYLELALSSPTVQEQMVGTGSGLQHIHLRDLRADCVPLPSLEEQHEIIRRVDALFKLADAIEKRIAAATLRAEKLTQAILAKAFRGELVPTEAELARREGRKYEPASVLLERIRKEREKALEKKPLRGKRVRVGAAN